MPLPQIILASNNSGKIREFNTMLTGAYQVLSMSDKQVTEVPETGLTFVENALIKARNASKQSGLPALADDSGLVVDALNSAPGIYSARYAGTHGDDEANTQKLLRAMQNQANRAARFWCACVFVQHAEDPTPIIVQRGWEGEILRKKTGKNGFGYDPIFYVPSHGCASAELLAEEKNKISHRGKALQAVLLKTTAIRHLKLPPLSLYIHYPWCVKKCPYCDFNSHENDDKRGYIQALLDDLDADLVYVQGRAIQSIFIGGGTPSLMDVEDLKSLFLGLKSKLDFAQNIEITLETNPGSFEVEKFRVFKEIGINRLSIGVQSFNDKHLQSLGRIHNALEASEACFQASQTFDNFNIDLMYGLENQTIEACLGDIHQALAFNPIHVSFYQLTLEPNTYFAKYPPKLPKDELIWQMGNQGVQLLESNGFERYEVSAFGKVASMHNLNYWQFGDYLGIGAGAHGKITLLDKVEPYQRTTKAKSPKDYLQNPNKQITPIENLPFDFMLNALRLKQGFEVDLFQQRTGQNIDVVSAQLIQACDLGLLKVNQHCIVPTEKGYNFLNDCQEMFL